MSDNTLKMEEENQHVTSSEIRNGTMIYHRELAPSQHLLQIKSYSVLEASKLKRFESDVFEACGFNWKIILYPCGHSDEANEDKHISLYLAISETDENLPIGWEIWAKFNLFVHDQINNKFLVIKDAQNKLKRFCSVKTERGFDEFLLVESFKDINNGYLINDCCTFGAEVMAAKYSGKRECVSTVLKPSSRQTYTWNLEKFSQITTEFRYSKSFLAGGLKWKLKVYPKGDKDGRNEYVSVFLVLDEKELRKRCYAEFTLTIKNQYYSSSYNIVANGEEWFSVSHNYGGLSKFMLLRELRDASTYYCMNDKVIIECEISFIIQAQLYEH